MIFRVCLLGFILFGFHFGLAQGIRLDEIKSATRDSSNAYFYPRLIDEFVSQPEYFSADKGKFLYYGQIYSRYYKLFDFGKNVGQFNLQMQRGRMKKAIPLGEKVLEENPVNLEVLMKLGYCYRKDNQPEKARTMQDRAAVLIRAIESNGDGSSEEQAYKVISISDEYVVMGKEGFTQISRKSKQQAHSVIDILEVRDAKSKDPRPLYFEVLYNHDAIPK